MDSGFGAARRPYMTALEFHLQRFLDRPAVFAEIEELLRREAERGGEQRRRKLGDARIVFADRIVEEAPRRGELVLDVRQLGLQLLEICVGLEVSVGLR